MPIFDELRDFRGKGNSLNNLGIRFYYEGRWEEALDAYAAAREALKEGGYVIGEGMAANNEGEIASDQGHFERAEEAFLHMLRASRAAGYAIGAALATSNLARVAARARRFDEARTLYAEAIDGFVAIDALYYVADTRARLAECHVLEGRYGEAIQLATETLADESAGDAVRILAERALGYALHQARRPDEARPHLEESLLLARKAASEYDIALTLRALARRPGSATRRPAPRRTRSSSGSASSRSPASPCPSAAAGSIRRPVDLDLTSEQELIRDTVREFARERVAPVAEELDRESRFPYELVAELGELGLMGLPIPEEYGGAGGDTVSYAIAIEELTRIDSSVAITVAAHTSLGTMPIFLFGSEEQKREWLPDLASGRKLAAFGLTEPGAGSDAGNTRTTAELRDGEWIVNGAKMFITNAGTDITSCVTITARTGDDEISNIIVPNGTPGYEISPPMKKLGWRASDTRELSFRDCAVPEGNLLGPRGQGFRQFLEILDGGRISVAAMGVGLAQGAYDLAYAYAKEREQFGKPIASFQAIQFKLADMATEVEAGRALVQKAAWLKDQGRPFAREAAMAKLYTGELSNRAVNWSLQIHGGYGYMDEFAISRLYRDQKILEIGEGTNEVQRLVIAKLLGL